MEKPIKPGRITALACMLMLLVIVFVVALYKLQIVDGKAYYEENRNSVASSQTVAAARGSILDRYGRVLVSNTSCNNLVFNPDDLFEQDDPNGILLRLARTVVSCGDTYVDELPVTTAPPFEYTDMSETQRTQLKGFLKYAGLDEEATAVELLSYCREKFEINNNYSAADMRTIAGLRYSIKTRYIDKLYLPDYVFVKDASMELITSLKENNVPGFEVTVSYTRQYHTNLAAHLLGYTGLMNAEEYTTYKTQGYPMSATVGKDGAELAFEKYLHGTDGTAIVTKNAAGTVTGTTYTKEPEPGDQVSLTIDLDLQSAAEQSLTKGIENMKSKSTENQRRRRRRRARGGRRRHRSAAGHRKLPDLRPADALPERGELQGRLRGGQPAAVQPRAARPVFSGLDVQALHGHCRPDRGRHHHRHGDPVHRHVPQV